MDCAVTADLAAAVVCATHVIRAVDVYSLDFDWDDEDIDKLLVTDALLVETSG